ncbi:hypothetical protein [Vibrio gazogenes]|uniref:Uncharacterized protein n=1 Tax=Vibrio gazogenes DSM 21264 = NBRC 103151 TaxID=1123492 RepID=A0A1M5A4C7_VIBGA|nr:hypothetical protein [Vibrio gazogenes]USP13359.1 hypothetical protein MKS89_13215 [Vibrio gazogenes]SHF25084.1 hypothetical protein SAMN02745781_01804 [Vibrio gazogenes DSM 21264] [Vibrio gazogenes DSM 21264 = NBRC 103151]SJN57015.1 hypothetical protein BQ6471_02333 [Vibrio gazogenes]
MEILPFEILGERNFPDIELQDVIPEDFQITIIGEMRVESIVDTTLADGLYRLTIASESRTPLVWAVWQDEAWLPVHDSLVFQQIFSFIKQPDEQFVIEGLDEKNEKIRLYIHRPILQVTPMSSGE